MRTPDLLFGRIAVRRGFCTLEDVERALDIVRERASGAEAPALGTVMLEMKILSREQLDEIIKAQRLTEIRREAKLFGQLAVKNEFCTDADIAECLKIQEQHVRENKSVPRIGELLVKAGRLTGQEREALLTLQHRLRDTRFWRYIEAQWQRSREH